MKTTKSLAWVVALGALASAFASCSEPPTACQVGLAGSTFGYATKYTVTTAPQGCPAGFVPQLGDLIGMEDYHPQLPGPVTSTSYNVNITTVAMQSDTLGNEVDVYTAAGSPDPLAVAKACTVATQATDCPGSTCNTSTLLCSATVDQAFALGSFAAENPNAANQCPVIGIAPAVEKFPAVPKATPALPADSVTYAWSNVSIYVTAADQGNQFSGDVTITDNSCVVTYHAIGLWPGVSCTDYQGNPNPDLCNPCSEPNLKRPVGSGISPDAATTCQQIFSENDPYKGTYSVQECWTDADCASVSSEFTSQCIGGVPGTPANPAGTVGSCTYCQDNFDCPNGWSCQSPGFCYNRTPYFCVLAGTSDPPVLNPTPPTCASSGGGGSSPGTGGSSPSSTSSSSGDAG